MKNSMAGSMILFLMAIGCWVLSGFQFRGKGILLNNAFLYASEKERKEMDKWPYYRQTGVIFLLIGGIFFVNGLELLLETGWLFFVVLGLIAVAVFYAIASSVVIARRKKDDVR